MGMDWEEHRKVLRLKMLRALQLDGDTPGGTHKAHFREMPSRLFSA